MLPRSFYARPTLPVARDLLGKTLVHALGPGERRAGRIVETEAYLGRWDLASHARHGPRGRAAIMFGPAGHAYVYLIYGVYHCFNAVCEDVDVPGAVLVRAVEPLEGAVGERTGGPGLVCKALHVDRSCTGLDLTAAELIVEDAPEVSDEVVRMGPRVGVDYAGPWAERPWRFWIGNSAHVSRKTRGVPFDPAVLSEPFS